MLETMKAIGDLIAVVSFVAFVLVMADAAERGIRLPNLNNNITARL